MNSHRSRKPVSQLKSHIGFWIRLVSNHVSHSFARKLNQSGVTVAEWVVLREMYEHQDKTSPGHVSKLTGLTKGAISKLIDRLLEKNLVLREPSVNDRRYQEIKLTRKAIALVPDLATLADQNDDEFFSALTAKERRELVAILQKIAMQKKLKAVPIA